MANRVPLPHRIDLRRRNAEQASAQFRCRGRHGHDDEAGQQQTNAISRARLPTAARLQSPARDVSDEHSTRAIARPSDASG